MKRLHIPGVSIGIYHKGKEWAAGFGVTSEEHPLPVTPDKLFQVGSISKTFTGTLIMMLAEQGKVDLDVPSVNTSKTSNSAMNMSQRMLRYDICSPTPAVGSVIISITLAMETKELAVMVDTFYPLSLTKDALEFEKPEYMSTWMEGSGE